MLTQMRKGASSWPMKIVLGVIALSFVAWGVGDIFTGRGDTTVASVSGTDIDARELQAVYRDQVQRLQASGVSVEQGSELARALAEIAVQDIVQRTLYRVTADDMGITVGDDTVRADIAQNAMFHDASGNFAPEVFRGVLATSGLTEQSYVALLRDQIAVSQLQNGIGAVPPAPEALVDALHRHRNEERRAEVAVIANEALAEAPQPGQGELEAWFETRARDYAAPEYRSADYVLVYPADIEGEMTASEEELRQAYDANAGQWTKPERRRVQRMPFATEEAAREARERIAGGEDFAAVAAEAAGVDQASLELGWIVRADLFGGLADPVFALEPGAVSNPVPSPLGGWLLFQVTEVEPEETTSFEEAREEVARHVRMEKAYDALFDLANDLDDLLASGDTVRQAAETLGIERRSVDLVEASGVPQDPMSLQPLPDAPEFLPELFAAEPELPTPVLETEDGGIMALEVTELVEARQRSLEEVRAEVLADWQAERRAELARKAAREAAAALGSSEPLASAFTGLAVQVQPLGPLTRSTAPAAEGIGLDTVAALFEARPGEVVVTPSTDGSAQVVARLLEVIPAEAAVDAAARQTISDSLSNALVLDMGDQFRRLMRERHSVTVDRSKIERYF